jgi:hypothetical protein
MRAVSLYVIRVLLVLLAIPLGLVAADYVLLGGNTQDGDAGLVVLPYLPVFIGLTVILALFINKRFLRSKRPAPYWFRSRLVRLMLGLLVIVVFVIVIVAYNPKV